MFPRFRAASFAPTCLLEDEGRAPPRGGLRLLACACGCDKLVRIRRSLWMRLLPMLRLYHCRRCSARFLHPRIDRKTSYGYVYRSSVILPPRKG
ncbi:MAG: hypothetical protein ACO1PB_18385 [Ramlibacter sp.]